jgi:hypothetical protein
MYRQITGLKRARALDERPQGIPVGRARGAKGNGIRYERAVAASLPEAIHGQWFEFVDANGPGWCQTDLLLAESGKTVIVEVKYTWTGEAWTQLERLYKPVVELAFGRPVVGIVCCRRLLPETLTVNAVSGTLGEALTKAKAGVRSTWHCVDPAPVPRYARALQRTRVLAPGIL